MHATLSRSPSRIAPRARRVSSRPEDGARTLAIDIGGTGLKALMLDPRGAPLTTRLRVDTPRPATPRAVLTALVKLVAPLEGFDRISVGFPGVVLAGVIKTAPNLHRSWADVPLAEKLERLLGMPTRVLNDAGVQGFGVIDGKGLEMVLTLGTGLGCALFYDGTYIPNLELAHHPFRKSKTYEEYLGDAALRRDGKKKWNHHVAQAIKQIDPIWNPDRIFVGGGNAKYVTVLFPPHVRVTSNVAGLLGGIALWEGHEGAALGEHRRETASTRSTKGRNRVRGRLYEAPRRDGRLLGLSRPREFDSRRPR